MRTLILAGALLFPALTGLGACGFTPVYSTRTGVSDVLRDVDIDAGQGRIGYQLRSALVEQLGAEFTPASPAYALTVKPQTTRTGFGLRIDDVATRFEIQVTARFALTETATGQVVHRGAETTRASFDLPGDPYANLSAEETAREKAIQQVAKAISRELSFFLSQQSRDDATSG